MRQYVVLPAFNGVAAGQTATIDLPVGALAYHWIDLFFGCTNAGNGNQANLESYITEVRLKLNGKVQRRFSAKELDTINAFYGAQYGYKADGTLAQASIFFSEPWRRTPQGEDALAWGMADVASFQIEVDLAAGVTGPTLTAKAEIERVNRVLGPIIKWRKYTIQVAAAGIVTVNTLPKIDAYYELHAFLTAAADLTDLTVTVDNQQVFKALRVDIDNLNTRYGFTPQANVTSVVFDRTKRVSDSLSMVAAQKGSQILRVQNFQIDWNMANANSFPIQTLVLGPRD